MSRSRASVLLAGVAVLLSATQSIGQQVCKPALSFKETRVSEVVNRQRIWTAVLTVDASSCSTRSRSGHFEVEFTRFSEDAPELTFTERFKWRPQQVGVQLPFSWDEWPVAYRISEIFPCPCRDANGKTY